MGEYLVLCLGSGEYRWIQCKNSGIYSILIYLLFFVLGEIKHFFVSHQTAETAARLFKHSHTNRCPVNEQNSVVHITAQTQLSI